MQLQTDIVTRYFIEKGVRVRARKCEQQRKKGKFYLQLNITSHLANWLKFENLMCKGMDQHIFN